jgi:hypothetical protein
MLRFSQSSWFKILLFRLLILMIFIQIIYINISPLSWNWLVFIFNRWDSEIYLDIAINHLPLSIDITNIKYFSFYPYYSLVLGGITNNAIILNAIMFTTNSLLLCLLYKNLNQYLALSTTDSNEEERQLSIWLYLIFPFCVFLQFNYLDLLFIVIMVSILNRYTLKQYRLSTFSFLLLGFIKPTAIWFSIGLFIAEYKSFLSPKELFTAVLRHSLVIIPYALFSLYNWYVYNQPSLFSISQSQYFNRNFNLDFLSNVSNELLYNNPYRYFPRPLMPNYLGLDWTYLILILLPLVVFIIGLIDLYRQRQYRDIIISLSLTLPQVITLSLVSFNRYIIYSFPVIIAFNSWITMKNKKIRLFLTIAYLIIFVFLSYNFLLGFWIG